MSIETPEVDLDRLDEPAILHNVADFEKQSLPLVTLTSSIEDWEKIRKTLLALRSSNVSAVLLLKKSEELLEDDEIQAIFTFLRDWDQLLLQNVLELCEGWIPQVFLAPLQNEAKIELKWFKEWWIASSDPRIHKYPGLPWRRFVRKVVGENYDFASHFLTLVALPATAENIQAVQSHFNTFLESKKKVLSIFPKKWSKLQ